MVLQVGAVRRKLAATLAEDADALAGVERAGRTALAERRRVVGMRRDGEDVELAPQPGLGGLDSLVEEVRRAGLLVQLHIDGDAYPLPQAMDLSAGASGFVLKDDPPGQLIAAIRTVAAGDALLHPRSRTE